MRSGVQANLLARSYRSATAVDYIYQPRNNASAIINKTHPANSL